MVDVKQPKPLWETQGEEKRDAVQGLFSRIAKNYDFVNRVMSFNRDRSWRKLAVSKLNLKPGNSVLDICCGTGDFFTPIRKQVGASGKIAGIDFCAPMLSQASAKDENSFLVLGDACRLPFVNASFDAITVGWGIRNVPDIELAHQEIYRVLRPGGTYVSLDCAEPESTVSRKITGFGRTLMMNVLGASFRTGQEYAYLNESSKRFKTRQELVQIMQQAGFDNVKFQDLMFGNICIHWGTKS